MFNDVAQMEMSDVKYMSAEEKRKVLRQWEAFLKGGLKKEQFTKELYHHLMQHCSFIAHYDIHGFYATYFEKGDTTIDFLSQFHWKNPKSVEYGWTSWVTDKDYADINCQMCRVAEKYLPALELQAKNSQKQTDLAYAEFLLKKHGMSMPGGTG
jgi:thioesterase domain-containing protein